MRIELSCSACGQNRFNIVQGMADDAVVRCADCGREVGTMAQLKERVAAEVMRRAASSRTAVSSHASRLP